MDLGHIAASHQQLFVCPVEKVEIEQHVHQMPLGLSTWRCASRATRPL